MAHDESATNVIDAGDGGSDGITKSWNGYTMSVPGTGKTFNLSNLLRESRKRSDAPPPPPAVAPSGLLANLLRRI